MDFVPDKVGPCPFSRRTFLRLTGGSAAAAGVGLVLPATQAWSSQILYLHLKHANTGEDLQVVYYKDGQVDANGLARLDWFMRDFREGQAVQINRRLYYLMSVFQYLADWRRPMTVLSGFRTRKTNNMLVERGGAALNSLHLYGMALDFRIPGIDMQKLRDIAIAYQQGGVGWYPKSDFVHVDVGPVRRWEY